MAEDDPPGAIGPLTSRAEAQVLRLSLIYALLASADRIEREHLESAWEVWRYCRWSAQHIFVGAGTGDRDVDRIRAVLDDGDEITGRELDRMFPHADPRSLRERAVSLGVADIETRKTDGRPRVVLVPADGGDPTRPRAQWWRHCAYSRSSSADLEEAAALKQARADLDAHVIAPPQEAHR
jgi:hypothetical protein